MEAAVGAQRDDGAQHLDGGIGCDPRRHAIAQNLAVAGLGRREDLEGVDSALRRGVAVPARARRGGLHNSVLGDGDIEYRGGRNAGGRR